MSLDEAASLIQDGDTVAIGGLHMHSGPMAIVRALLRHGRRNLTLLPNVSAGLAVDLLIAGGGVSRLFCCYVGLEHYGLAPAFRRAAEAGELEVLDVDEPFIIYALKAASANLPFMPLPRGHRATDTMELNPEYYRLICDPFTGGEHVCVPQVRPDVGIIHAPVCDPYGNVHIPGSLFHDDLIAKASRRVIVTTDCLATPGVAHTSSSWTTIPGFFVDAVVALPFAAHPTSSQGHYRYDDVHLREYKAGIVEDYIDKYIAIADHYRYLERVGIRQLSGLAMGGYFGGS